jgi:ribonuclease HI
MMFCAFTDGACKGNPGKGGWGWLEFKYNEKLEPNGLILTNCGGCENTTNNRMEITAVFEYLKEMPVGRKTVIYSDSQYVLKSLIKDGLCGTICLKKDSSVAYTGWMKGWKQSSFLNVKNSDLWKKLDKLLYYHLSNGTSSIEFRYVKGHSDSKGNNLADKLANEGVKMIN